VKEAIFHPEARAEMRESVEFYEVHLDGLGFRFLAAVEQAAERISTHPEAGTPLAGGFRKRIVRVFPTASSIACERITFTWLLSPISIVGRAIGGSEPAVAHHSVQPPARATAFT